jgi:hypothetical protein
VVVSVAALVSVVGLALAFPQVLPEIVHLVNPLGITKALS